MCDTDATDCISRIHRHGDAFKGSGEGLGGRDGKSLTRLEFRAGGGGLNEFERVQADCSDDGDGGD